MHGIKSYIVVYSADEISASSDQVRRSLRNVCMLALALCLACTQT